MLKGSDYMLDFYLGNIAESNHIFVIIFFLLIKLIMAIYAYTDSKKRNMQSIMWMLLVLLIPNYIGLIIYLIVRQNDDYLNCPNCGFKVKRSFKVCPNCNQPLTKICPSCKKIVKDDWNVCPYCTEILKKDNEMVMCTLCQGHSKKKNVMQLFYLDDFRIVRESSFLNPIGNGSCYNNPYSHLFLQLILRRFHILCNNTHL